VDVLCFLSGTLLQATGTTAEKQYCFCQSV